MQVYSLMLIHWYSRKGVLDFKRRFVTSKYHKSNSKTHRAVCSLIALAVVSCHTLIGLRSAASSHTPKKTRLFFVYIILFRSQIKCVTCIQLQALLRPRGCHLLKLTGLLQFFSFCFMKVTLWRSHMPLLILSYKN